MCNVLRGQPSSAITLGMARAMVAVTLDNAQPQLAVAAKLDWTIRL
jgi:hypothetical protein